MSELVLQLKQKAAKWIGLNGHDRMPRLVLLHSSCPYAKTSKRHIIEEPRILCESTTKKSYRLLGNHRNMSGF